MQGFQSHFQHVQTAKENQPGIFISFSPNSCHTFICAVGDDVWLLQVGLPGLTSHLLGGRFPPSYPPLGWEEDVHLSAQATADQCALGHRGPHIKFTYNYNNVAVTRISASLLRVGRFIEGNKIKGHYYYLYRPEVLNLWVTPPLWGEQPFHRGQISDILLIRYFHYDSQQ